MADTVIMTDDQPMEAGFFKTGTWLTDYITPDSLDIQALYDEITEGISAPYERILALYRWVPRNIRYVDLVKGRLTIEGYSSVQNDLWNEPAITAKIGVGNCANSSFLLASLLRNELPASQVYCVLGNLYNGSVGGHAWVQISQGGRQLILESTIEKEPILAEVADRYEAVHYFNDKEVMVVPGRTVMEPYMRNYSEWLSDYLDWAYIEGEKEW